MPRLYLIPSEQPNAFATGRNPQHAAVAVTEGLLEQLPADQVKGVLAHEFAHIKNHDILISSIAAMVAGAISAIATVLQFSMLFGGSDEEDSPLGLVGTLAAIIVAPIAAMLLQLGVSRQREYLADADGRAVARPGGAARGRAGEPRARSAGAPDDCQLRASVAVRGQPAPPQGARDAVHDPPPDRRAGPAAACA